MAIVFYQIVSRVVHNHPNVRSVTRSHVLTAIDTLEYGPNSAARALVAGSSHTLRILALDTPSSTGLVSQHAIEQVREMQAITSVSRPSEKLIRHHF